MDLNWLDLVIGGILLISLLAALRNGMTKEVVRIVALICGVLGGMWFYPRVAAELAPYIENEKLANFAAFGAIVLGCLILGGLIAWGLDKIWGFAGLRWFDRLLGAGFGFVRGMLVAMALVMAVVAFAPVESAERTVATSRLAPLVLLGAGAVSRVAPAQLRDAYDSGFERVRAVWTGVPGSRKPVE
ncbi:MAG: CvpA family protein [Bryobacterales bacterium]|nr:CvpA family protein [Acidobacteriota bacterium]MCB9384816.1 CvpA family protein [Bryobacterales bacterium]